MTYVGQRVPSLTNTKLVAGRGRFVDGIQLPRMTYAAVLRSPSAHARIRSMDTSQAEALPADYPDEVIDDFAFNGPPERIVEMLNALAEVRLDEVAPCYLNGRLDEMEIVGREIIPAVAALAA